MIKRSLIFKSTLDCMPCPVCGKQPKTYMITNTKNDEVTMIKIICKPFLRKAHCIHIDVKPTAKEAYHNAVNNWNEEAEDPVGYGKKQEEMRKRFYGL